MKKLILLLGLYCLVSSTTQAQSTYVIEDGVTYTRILTREEFISVGGYIMDEGISGGGHLSSVRTLSCDKDDGNCTGATLETNEAGVITAITLPEQTDLSGDQITTPITDIFAYYNAELDRIIFR